MDDLIGQGALFLVFAAGNCPDSGQIARAIDGLSKLSISNRSDMADADGDHDWLELLCEGLTFDLKGIAEPFRVDAQTFPSQFHGVTCDQDDQFEALVLMPGPHLMGGQSQLPIFRAQMALAVTIGASLTEIAAFGWLESKSLIGCDQFVSIVDRWLNGGPVPVPGLISLRDAIDGGVQSVGLSFFTGQELRIEPDQSVDSDDMARLAARLAAHLFLSGKLETTEQITAPDGNPLRLEPSGNGNFVRVWRR